jgi:hypothetical protein
VLSCPGLEVNSGFREGDDVAALDFDSIAVKLLVLDADKNF